jgi:hypothetical protein
MPNSLHDRLLFSLTVAALLSCSAWVFADERPVQAKLTLTRTSDAEECIDEPTLARTVEQHLGRPVFAPTADLELQVTAKLARAEPSWTADIELSAANGRVLGRRRLSTEAEHCSALDGALALALALMVDLSREELSPPPNTPADLESPPTPPPRRNLSLPPDTPAPREPWTFSAGVMAAGALGAQPDPAWGGRLVLGVAPPRGPRFELEGSAFTHTTAEADAPGAGVEMRLVTLGTFVCPLSFWDDALSLCAGQIIGQTQADGFGFDRNRSEQRLSWALGARVRGAVRVFGPLQLRAGLGGETPLFRDRFVYRQGGRAVAVFRMAPVVGSAELGIGLSLP